MLSKDQGYGIAGAKNVYAHSTTRIGNWVEDSYGVQLAHTTRTGERCFDTEYKTQHRAIEDRPAIPEGNFVPPSVRDLKAKNKDGLPYVMLFKHGKGDIPIEERFTTMAKTSSLQSLNNFAAPEGTLRKQKEKLATQDILAARNMTTEARFANGYIAAVKSDTIPRAAIGRSEDLPIWGRRCLIDK